MSVRLSVTSRSSVESAGRIELVFLARELFPLSYSVLKGNSDISKNKVLPSGTLSQTLTPDLENFASAYRSSKRVINLAGERWTLGA